MAWTLALLAGVFAAGCSDECLDLCESAEACPGAVATDEAGCIRQCQDARAQAEVADCGDPYDDYLGCASDEDACPGPGACDAEADAYTSCIAGYCSGSPDDLACQEVPGT